MDIEVWGGQIKMSELTEKQDRVQTIHSMGRQ